MPTFQPTPYQKGHILSRLDAIARLLHSDDANNLSPEHKESRSKTVRKIQDELLISFGSDIDLGEYNKCLPDGFLSDPDEFWDYQGERQKDLIKDTKSALGNLAIAEATGDENQIQKMKDVVKSHALAFKGTGGTTLTQCMVITPTNNSEETLSDLKSIYDPDKLFEAQIDMRALEGSVVVWGTDESMPMFIDQLDGLESVHRTKGTFEYPDRIPGYKDAVDLKRHQENKLRMDNALKTPCPSADSSEPAM
ncbi:hypothetical protein [Neptuniibacter sp. QD37_11]|uniref:hypothetical protein n=1 Tax=Neptuniibacter sp. QD37_11 TaxID=3398209 RepID=UPI0039F63120